jgi:DNA topoisomerase-6 subunit B
MSNRQAKAATASDMAARQRDISVSEFFLKNRHLLGFDTPSKALVTAVKEAVDNAIDACEEAGMLPDIIIQVRHHDGICRIAVEDNGPGIVESQIARIFGKLLYGSKFHKLSQSRGQQGMGISAAGMYGQLTVGKPLHILSRVDGDEFATELLVSIDTTRNRPDIHRKKHLEWDRPHGIRVEMAIEGHYQKGPHSVESYLKQTAIANPHATLEYQSPNGEQIVFARSTHLLPPRPREIKPHPQGVELGRLIQMLSSTESRTLLQFLIDEFSSIGKKTALTIIENAGGKLSSRSYPKHIARAQATALHRAIQKTRIQAPRTDCIVPIGERQILDGLHKELEADFFTATTRPAAAYQGNPFQVEVAIAYGRAGDADVEIDKSGRMSRKDSSREAIAKYLIARDNEPVRLLRFANRVPLLYQQSSCAITKAVIQTNWRAYGLRHAGTALPIAPMAILVHVASVWIPYTSEAKEAVEPYPEILKEIRLGLQQCGRDLTHYLRRRNKLEKEYGKRVYIEKYLPHIGIALQDILALNDSERDRTVKSLDEALHRSRSTKRPEP